MSAPVSVVESPEAAPPVLTGGPRDWDLDAGTVTFVDPENGRRYMVSIDFLEALAKDFRRVQDAIKTVRVWRLRLETAK